MRFYISHTKFYCGVDLHARNIYICIMDKNRNILEHRNLKNQQTDLLLKLIAPYKESIVVACESCYAWYWLADLCADNGIEFILGHALYMKAIHGSKVKNDRIDSKKIAMLVLSGMFPIAYVYPRNKRAVRDLLRRRLYFVKERSDMFCHLQLLNHQANNDDLGKLTRSTYKRKGIAERFEDVHALKSIDADMKLLNQYDSVIRDLEIYILEYTR
ncbi:MAG: transposase, partial [Candidatus Omnitrophica bacterium]|nr:transposase [Candidatus Omnitrophota bacterium]